MKDIKKKAVKKAGFREKYAMENGTEEEFVVMGHKCIRFTYSEEDPYQDANGATYDTVADEWID